MDNSTIQKTLNKLLGAKLDVDGKVGPYTKDAIKDFQDAEGLKVDGIAGPKTQGRMEEVVKARKRRLLGSGLIAIVLAAIVAMSGWFAYNYSVLFPSCSPSSWFPC